ncbi:hypothetical protein RHSIM_Rhsim04G0041200 [Rhododendron simsii]|uniref:F-box associated domain-containing protein n=1 Tax=Rhododendron simsii TaxID=118357 RepID=A0A834LQE5_RHOSS|nr:hypothetical protein RHSIM_Rhsim04G0041200 [Rhododendron simsii]
MTDQYNVVRSFCNGDYHEVEIYTLGEGFWRSIRNDPYGVRRRFDSSFDTYHTFVSGALHLLAFDYCNPDLIVLTLQVSNFQQFLDLRGFVGVRKNICALKCYKDVPIYGIASMFRGTAHVPSLVSLGDIARGENLKVNIPWHGFVIEMNCAHHTFQLLGLGSSYLYFPREICCSRLLLLLCYVSDDEFLPYARYYVDMVHDWNANVKQMSQ